jgi:hypothetical protein
MMRVWFILVLYLLVCQAGTAYAKQPTLYLFTVSVDRYSDQFWPALRWPVRDAARIEASVGNVAEFERDARSLKGPAATRDKVLREFAEIARVVQPNDVVVFYFSGHGTLTPELDRTLVLFDTDAQAANGLKVKAISDWLGGIRARRKVAILAACHSGVGKSKLPPEVQRYLSQNKGAIDDISSAAYVLSAAAAHEIAREEDSLNGDVYTHFFVNALTSGDRNEDGVVTALEAHEFATRATVDFSKGRQRPTAEVREVGDIDIPLAGKRTARGFPVLYGYEQYLAGWTVRVNGNAKGMMPQSVVLDRGSNVVEVAKSNGPAIRFRLRAAPGEALTVAEALAPDPWAVSAFGSIGGGNDQTEQALGLDVKISAALRGSYEFRWAQVGVWAEQQRSSSKLREVDVETNRVSYYLTLGKAFEPRWRLPIRYQLLAGIGQEAANLSLSDGVSAQELASKKISQLLAADITLPIHGLFYAGPTVAAMQARHDFGEVGDLAGWRWRYGLSVWLLFGGKGARVW